MERLKEIAITQIRAMDLFYFAQTASSYCSDVAENDSFVARQIRAIESLLSTVRDIRNITRKSIRTEQISSSDSEMDELLRICRDSLELAVKQSKYYPEKAAASARIKKIFDLRSEQLYSGGYLKQGAELQNLFFELFKPEHDQDRIDCELAPFFDRIRELFEKIKELEFARMLEPKAPSTIREMRDRIQFRVTALLYHIDANIHDSVEGFVEMEVRMNNLITDVMANYRSRQTRKRNREEKMNSDQQANSL